MISKLSGRQQIWFVIVLVSAVAIVAVGWLRQNDAAAPVPAESIFTVEMSAKQIAPKLGVTGKGLLRELALPLDSPKPARPSSPTACVFAYGFVVTSRRDKAQSHTNILTTDG